MTRKWRVAILGLGHWYSAYNLARALQEYPKAELAAVAWHNSAQLAAFTGDFQIPGYHDYDELLKREDDRSRSHRDACVRDGGLAIRPRRRASRWSWVSRWP